MMAKRAREGEDEEEDDETMSSCSSRSSSFGSSNGERSVSVSPPVSPRRSGCYGRSASAKSMVSSREPGIGGMGLGVGVKVQGVGVGTLVISASSSPKCSIYKLLCIAASALPKRNGALLLIVPVMYISVMLLYMGSVYPFERGSGFNGAVVEPGGLVYRSPLLFERMWPLMIADNTSFQLKEAWRHQRTEEWVPCITRARNRGLPRSNGYIIIEANGGLNQQRTSICNAVAVAGLLNATLVIPKFLFNSIWQDSSKFGDIYDEDHFIKRLKNYVRVVREVPRDIMAQLDYKATNIYNFRVKAWSPPSYYLENVLPVLIDARVIKISPFANRLSLEVPYNIQNLRCLANYEALKFSKPISRFSKKLVERMIKASYLTHGKYVAVHLRFEEDMVAFSCCIYDGGETEKLEMDAARERGWRDKFNRNGRITRPGIYRRDGKCPLTPLEVGMMLRGMGFSNNTPIYLASGKIYRAQENMLPLRKMFPLLHTKETLASPEELAPFEGYSSRLAALDYTVCLHSEVFVTTQGGNFPHFLMGHRRYLFNGHAKTIKPDKRKLAYLFDNPALQWEKFKKHMQTMYRQSDVRGIEIRKANGSIFNLPVPDCMCSKMSLEQRMEDRR